MLQLWESYEPHLRPLDWTDSSFCISSRISATSLSLSAAVPALHSNKQLVSTARHLVKTFRAKGGSLTSEQLMTIPPYNQCTLPFIVACLLQLCIPSGEACQCSRTWSAIPQPRHALQLTACCLLWRQP